MNYYLTGDCHGDFSRFYDFTKDIDPKNCCFICLGDFCANYYLNKTDYKNKKRLNSLGSQFYIIRGNHEQRPSLIPTIQWAYDKQVSGIVGTEPEFPNIHYFKDDVNEYIINEYKCLIVPGAFSVDGEYRRQRTLSNGWCGWWENEQLTQEEMDAGFALAANKSYDFILSHTCPISIGPTDLFLSVVNQKEVDKTMENYLEKIKENTSFKCLCFGHYHSDRLERPNAQMFFQEVESMDDIFARVTQPVTAPDYKHIKSPNYYMEDN